MELQIENVNRKPKRKSENVIDEYGNGTENVNRTCRIHKRNGNLIRKRKYKTTANWRPLWFNQSKGPPVIELKAGVQIDFENEIDHEIENEIKT